MVGHGCSEYPAYPFPHSYGGHANSDTHEDSDSNNRTHTDSCFVCFQHTLADPILNCQPLSLREQGL